MMLWVLTYEVNEYDQFGAYFVAAFKSYPKYAELASVIANHLIQDVNTGTDVLEHVESVRRGLPYRHSNCWYKLTQIKFGVAFQQLS